MKIALSCFLFIAVVTTAEAQLSATATLTSVTVAGGTAHGRVAICRIANTSSDGVETLLGVHKIVRADDSGRVTLTADEAAFQAIWLVVDLTSGGYVIATPAGYVPRVLPPPLITKTSGRGAEKTTILWSRPTAHFWIAGRNGVWHGSAVEGRASDDGGHGKGSVSFDVKTLEKNTGDENETPPGNLVPGDVILVADLPWMAYSVVVVPKGGGDAS